MDVTLPGYAFLHFQLTFPAVFSPAGVPKYMCCIVGKIAWGEVCKRKKMK